MTEESILKAWQMVRHFEFWEFSSPDLTPESGLRMNIEFVKRIDELRHRCNFPFTINSGFRSPEWNKEVGGVPASSHTQGLATDIAVRSSRQRFSVLKQAMTLGFNRIGVGKTFIHLDASFDLPQGVLWLY